MDLKIVVNTYPDGFSGHVNMTLMGSIDGVELEPVTIGSTLEVGLVGGLSSVFGSGGVIKREDDLLPRSPNTTDPIAVDPQYAAAFMELYNKVASVDSGQVIDQQDWDPFPYFGDSFTDGTNCIHFTDQVTAGLGITLIDHLSAAQLVESYATNQVSVRRTTSRRFNDITLRSDLSVMPGQQFINTINLMVGNSGEGIC